MRAQGVHVTVRPLRRRRKRARLDDGATATFTVLEEKGIDVRIALDTAAADELRNRSAVRPGSRQARDLRERQPAGLIPALRMGTALLMIRRGRLQELRLQPITNVWR